MNLNDYIFYSGGAIGADSIWQKELEKIGCKVIVYRPEDIDNLNSIDKEIVDKQYIEVASKLRRPKIPIFKYTGKLMRRDMLQVKDADNVYAISTIDEKTGLINGGTGYSTTRAILDKKNVYLFEQNLNYWLKYNHKTHRFEKCISKPILKTKSAVVGSRNITDNGIQAILEIINTL